MHDHRYEDRARTGAGVVASWRASAATAAEVAAVLTAIVVVAALIADAPMPGWRVLVAVAGWRAAVPWLRHGMPHERAGRGELVLGIVRRRLLGDGRWEVQAADGRRHEVSTPLAYPRYVPLDVGAAVVLRRWPDGSARLERPRRRHMTTRETAATAHVHPSATARPTP